MAIKTLSVRACYPTIITSCSLKTRNLAAQRQPQSHVKKNAESSILISKRRVTIIKMVSIMSLCFDEKFASGLDMRLVAPEQTMEEAENGIRGHALALLEVKSLIDSESWSEAQKFLRKSSSYLKQDFYTIINGRPASERPKLRKLYFDLFSNVTKLDYAARDKDASRVLQCYDNIVIALNDVLSRI